MRRWYAVLVAAWVALGTIPLAVRRVDLPAAAIVLARLWIAALALGAVLSWRRGRSAHAPPPLASRAVLVAGTLLAVHWLALFAAYQRAPTGTVILITYLAPVIVAALAPLLLRERPSAPVLIALVIAVAGLAVLTRPAVRAAGITGLMLSGTAATTLAALILVSKPLAELHGGVRLAFGEFVVAGTLLAPVGAAAGWGEPRIQWAWLIVLGVVHTALAVSLLFAALGRVPATPASILGYLEPVTVIVVGWLFLEEELTASTLAGAALVLAAGAIVVASSGEETARVPG